MATAIESGETIRNSDISDEPVDRLLVPIRGYEDQPIVPLTEIVQPISGLFNNIQDYVYVALHNCSNPSDGLNQQESASIQLYTMQFGSQPSLYYLLNQTLRAEDREQLKPWFSYLKLFLTALYKLPSQNKIVWRGIKNVDLTSKYKTGTKFVWWGVSSCTTHIEVLESEEFLGKNGERTIFSIECFNGKSISNHSYFKNKEEEIILMPGSYFEVIRQLNPASQLHIIQLKQIQPPITFITSPFKISSNIITNEKIFKLNNKWKQHSTIVAGGNGRGNLLNQLHYPYGIFIDDYQTIYTADRWNDRIVEWKSNTQMGRVVAGGNGQGQQTNQLNQPTDVIIDKEKDSLIIADWRNRRVMRWSLQNNTTNGLIIIEDIDCVSLAMDKHGSIYVSDWKKDEVRRWKRGEKKGTIVAGGNGKGDQLNQFNSPYSIFVDENESLYVSDHFNHRVMKWVKDGKEGILVAGGNGKGNSLKQLSYPYGVIVDLLGQIYVADYYNHRVMCWCEGGKEGRIVVGGNGEGNQSNQFSYPIGLSFDVEGNLYVADRGNHRIVKFEFTYKDQIPNVTTNVQSTSVFNSDVVGLSLQPSKYYITPSRQNTMNNIPVLLKPISDKISNILIACFNIDSWLLPSNSKYSIEPFSDECVCIARLLSIINKHVYFIVSSSASEYIIPLVYQHQCIEQIYILSSEEIQQKTTLINGLPKVQGSWTDYNVLLSHLYRDIDSVLSQPLLWSNEELIHRYYTQCLIQLSNRPSISLDSSILEKYSISNTHISIVVLHCDNYVLFDIESQRFHLSKFSNVDKCIEYLGITDISSVFFIISGEKNSITRDIRKITMLKRIYTIYLFVPETDIEELTEPLLSYKNIGRLFDNLELLLNCVTADIKFYLEQLFYIPKLSVFPLHSDTQVNIKTGFTKIQEEFVAFELFVNSFREAPTFISQNQTLSDRCINLVKDKSNIENILQILKDETNEIFNWFIDDSFLFVCMNSFLQEEFPRNLLDIQQLLATINQHFVGLTSTTSSTTVYRVQLLNEEKLKIIEANINELIVLHTYLLATKDLLNARTIARQAANRGLLVILFQIEYSTTENVLELDNGRSMFRFGTIFRIRSINLGADNVWYTQLDHADSDFQPIQERLQFQVGNRLTWLTLGKYLSVINHTTHAKCYYEHLLKNLPHDHPTLPSIYNNIGLICAELGDHQSSLKYYNEALELLKKSSQSIDHVSEYISFETLSQSVENEITANDYLLHDTKDETYSQQSQNEQALKCYRKALELETDPLIRFQYELKIKDILSSK